MPRTASVRASEPLDALELSGEHFVRILKNDPGIQQQVEAVIAARTTERDVETIELDT